MSSPPPETSRLTGTRARVQHGLVGTVRVLTCTSYLLQVFCWGAWWAAGGPASGKDATMVLLPFQVGLTAVLALVAWRPDRTFEATLGTGILAVAAGGAGIVVAWCLEYSAPPLSPFYAVPHMLLAWAGPILVIGEVVLHLDELLHRPPPVPVARARRIRS